VKQKNNRFNYLKGKKMKKIVLAIAVLMSVSGVKAQELSVGADVVSSYVWRGVQQGLGGLNIQPGLGFSVGGLSIGAWGSAGLVGDVKEVDFAIAYEIAGLSIGLTDYWWDGNGAGNYDDYHAHHLEVNVGYTLPIESFPLSLSWNTFVAGNVGLNVDGKKAYTSYFAASYPFAVKDIPLEVAIGLNPLATDLYGSYYDGFVLTDISLKASKEIKIGDFTLPLFGQVIVAPELKDIFFVAGISF
jgi:hypothetical protein